MKRTVRQDPFFLDQPPLAFLDELRSPMHHKPLSYGTRDIAPGETDARGIFLAGLFPEGADVLQTVYDDLAAFTAVASAAPLTTPVIERKPVNP